MLEFKMLTKPTDSSRQRNRLCKTNMICICKMTVVGNLVKVNVTFFLF